MATKKKWYVVWKGIKPGIYDNWDSAKAQITGFQGAAFKSFESPTQAEYAFLKGPESEINSQSAKKNTQSQLFKSASIQYENSICVDAACSGNPGDMEYRGVLTKDSRQLFHQGPFKDGTNNIGEFLGIVHALAYLQKLEKHDTLIYTDSKTAIAWVRNKHAKTTLDPTPHNQIIFDLIKRAENWLKNNKFGNPIVKWDTENWGEIPADFGRK